MWLFGIPHNYMEMVEKISKCVYTTSLFLLFMLSYINKEFGEFLNKISFGAEINLGGVSFCMALFYLPLLIGISEHIFQVHDKISNVLGIRKAYDKNVIAYNIIERLGLKKPSYDFDSKKVDKILTVAFYKYASSTRPEIDSHLILLTLNGWCWFWVILDLAALLFAVGSIFLCLQWSIVNLISLELAIVSLILMLCLILKQIIPLTKQELSEIFSDIKRIETIRNDVVDALRS